MEPQIRFLVEQYYDVQKLRIEAFNRIVAWCGTQSQPTFENHKGYASHRDSETQAVDASHSEIETHCEDASHATPENQEKRVSQYAYENHRTIASHSIGENQGDAASHPKHETHFMSAEKPSILAHKIITLKVKPPEQIGDLVWYHNSLRETEKQLAKRLNNWSSKHPLRTTYLSNIKGIGPIFSSALIAWLTPISRFDNISKLWKYSGLAPGQKRRKGEKLGYNPHIKTLMWKIAGSFEKQKAAKSVYRTIYDEKKRYYLNRPDLAKAITDKTKGAKLHVRLMAMRYVSKHFLADLWLTWRKLEGLSITEPYSITIMQHNNFEQPQQDR